MIGFIIQIISQIEEEKSTKKESEKLIRMMNKWQCQIIKLNINHDQETQIDKERDNVTTQSHLDDLITFDPSVDDLIIFDSSDNLITKKHQRNSFDILLKRERMNLEEKTYMSYKEMLLKELDSYYFRSD